MNKIKEFEDTVRFAESKLKTAPKGTLYVKNIKNNFRYYIKSLGNGGKETYLSSKDLNLIQELQEKAYLEKLKRVAEHNLEIQKRILKLEKKQKDYKQLYYQLPEHKRNLIKPFISSEVEEIKKKIEKECLFWNKRKLDRKSVSRDLNFVTMNGERVRSKSELIIADRLKTAGVPYYYEGKYVFTDDELNSKKKIYEKDYDVWFPDFQVINTKTGNLFFWEHFGMLDNPEYCANCQFKLETYAKHGFIIGKNLIVTTESSQHSLNVSYVDKLISEFLV